MSSGVAALNRVLIIVGGLVLLAVGLAVVGLSTGWASSVLSAVGLGSVQAPGADSVIRGADDPPRLGSTGVLAIVLIAAVLVVVLGIGWLLAQLPPGRGTHRFRLPTTGRSGSLIVEPSALSDALEVEVAAISGVDDARIDLHGAAAEPRLHVWIAADEHADVGALTEEVHTTLTHDVVVCLQVGLDRLDVIVELTAAGGRSAGRVTSERLVASSSVSGADGSVLAADPDGSGPASVRRHGA